MPLVPASLGNDVVAQAQIELPLPQLLQIAFELGRAIPDGTLRVEETAIVPVAAPAPPSTDPWALVKEGQFEEAEHLLRGVTLDSPGRDRLRLLMGSSDPKAVAFACRASAVTNWKSNAVNMRSLLSHPAAEVRAAAAMAIGELAGPAMGPAVRPLLQDSDPAVKAAAEAAMKKLGW